MNHLGVVGISGTCSASAELSAAGFEGSAVSPLELQHTLTPREHAVLNLIIQGSTSKVAGGVLGISPRTIEFHRANIMQKLSARNVADLMRIVLQG